MEIYWNRYRAQCVFVLAASAAALINTADSEAAQTSVAVGYALEHSDNITRTLVPQSDTVHRFHLGFEYANKGPNLDLNIRGVADLRDYVENTYVDDFRSTVDANAMWLISPERFRWFFQDRLEPVRIDTTQPLTPDNLELINIFVTGPDFTIRLNSADAIDLEARYGDTRYQTTTALNLVRTTGAMRWRREISPVTTFSVNAEVADVEYKFSSISDYQRRDGFIRFQTVRSQSNFQMDLGGSEVIENSGRQASEPLFRLNYNYQPSADTTIGTVLAREFSDVARDVLNAPPDSGSGQLVPNVFYQERFELNYARGSERNNFLLRFLGRKRRYGGTASDEDIYGTIMEIRRELAERWDAVVFGTYGHREYLQLPPVPRIDVNTEYGLRGIYHLRRNYELMMEALWSSRSSNDSSLNYDEFRTTIGIMYRRASPP